MKYFKTYSYLLFIITGLCKAPSSSKDPYIAMDHRSIEVEELLSIVISPSGNVENPFSMEISNSSIKERYLLQVKEGLIDLAQTVYFALDEGVQVPENLDEVLVHNLKHSRFEFGERSIFRKREPGITAQLMVCSFEFQDQEQGNKILYLLSRPENIQKLEAIFPDNILDLGIG